MVDLSEHQSPPAPTPSADDRNWDRARRRAEKKHKFQGDVVAFIVVNLGLVGAWAATGFGYFWPGWVMGIWGALLLLDAWNLYGRGPVTDDDIRRELG